MKKRVPGWIVAVSVALVVALAVLWVFHTRPQAMPDITASAIDILGGTAHPYICSDGRSALRVNDYKRTVGPNRSAWYFDFNLKRPAIVILYNSNDEIVVGYVDKDRDGYVDVTLTKGQIQASGGACELAQKYGAGPALQPVPQPTPRENA